jgi:hypothetical protein
MYHKIIKNVLLPLLLVVLGGGRLSAEQSTNLQRIAEGMEIAAGRVFDRPGMPDTICVNVVEHPAGWLVYQAFLEFSSEAGVTAIRCTPPFFGEVLAAITNIRVDLVEIDDETLFRREVLLDLAFSLPRQGASGVEERYTAVEEVRITDTVERTASTELVDDAYQFTQPRYIASNSTSFWKRVAEPAIVLGTTVVMVILLFTTRSQ